MKLYLDVESAGLKGKLHLIQYSPNREPVKILRVSKNPNYEELLKFLNDFKTTVYGYNVGFDLFKLYEFFKCKPFRCQTIDLYQHLLTSKPLCYYPFVGGKSIVKLVRTPIKYEKQLTEILTNKIKKVIPKIAKVTIKRVAEKDKNNKVDKKLITLEFKIEISMKLKKVVKLFLEEDQKIIELEEVLKLPKDFGWKEIKKFPFIKKEEKEKYRELWEYNELLLNSPILKKKIYEYARKDIEYLWGLEDYLIKNGNEVNTTFDDTCIHVVAYTRYFGFLVNVKKAKNLQEQYKIKMERIAKVLKIDVESAKQRLKLLKENAEIPELIISSKSDKLKLLEDANLLTKKGKIISKLIRKYKPLAQRKKMLEVITNGNGRVYPDFKVVGTTTNRMCGCGGLNFQGVGRDKEIRELFYCSMGGDFDALEWTIAANYFKDNKMLEGLAQNIDPHLLTVFLLLETGLNYNELVKIKINKSHKKHKEIIELRNAMKRINFGILYFATAFKISQELDCSVEDAEKKMKDHFFKHYESLGKNRNNFYDAFSTADFDGWDKNSVSIMAESISGIFGHIRYVCFEKFIADFLWRSAFEISQIAKKDKEKILRRDFKGQQTMQSAIQSVCLGAAGQIQKTVTRQLGNYPIQNAGAVLTKKLMAKIWLKHHLPMMNVHDEINIPAGFEEDFKVVKKTVEDFLKEHGKKIKYLKMTWKKTITWADK